MFNTIKKINSSDSNVTKYVFTRGDAVAESVLYKYPTYEERTVICCSTQSGCPVGCRFCGAGDYFVRSLTWEEIVHQVEHCLQETSIAPKDIKRLQIMVMSMGEPLLNFKNLTKAFRVFYARYPQAKLLISSIGPRINYEPVFELAKEIPTIGLQFSVHESTDEKRNQLIPFENKLTLKELSLIGNIFFTVTGRKPFFNYCAKEDNITIEDADRLHKLFDPNMFEATISVVCERDESIAAANARQRLLAQNFMEKLYNKGFSTRMFDPAGQDDIGGGCGQLWFVQKWMQENPELARPSIGFNKPIIHTPTI
mgnify:FL=1